MLSRPDTTTLPPQTVITAIYEVFTTVPISHAVLNRLPLPEPKTLPFAEGWANAYFFNRPNEFISKFVVGDAPGEIIAVVTLRKYRRRAT